MIQIDNQVHGAEPIYFTRGFREDVDWVFGGLDCESEELCALAFIVNNPNVVVFYRCLPVPNSVMERSRDAVTLHTSSCEVQKVIEGERVARDRRCLELLIHIHPDNSPELSTVDIKTYEAERRCRGGIMRGGRGCPVLLVNQAESCNPTLLGFWVRNGRAFRSEIRCIEDDSAIAIEAWEGASSI